VFKGLNMQLVIR